MRVGHPPCCLIFLAFIIGRMSGIGADEPDAWDRVPPSADSLFKMQLPLGDDSEWLLRLGGHARTMAEAYRHPDFGFSGIREDAWVHHRVQFFMGMDHDRDLTLAAELTWGEMQERDPPLAPADEDRPDFLQLYAQTRWDFGDAELFLRAGRQLLIYGSGRLLSHREGANQRLSHDAIRFSWRQNGWQVDALFSSPVRISPDSFDNSSYFHRTQLWGLYATGPSFFGHGHGMDLYYLGLSQKNSPLSRGLTEHRHTFGTRWFGKTERWRYNHELILQTGTIRDRDVLAGAVSLGLNRLLRDLMLKPVLGLKADLISGGQTSSLIHTFNPLFQANNYFNEGGFISPSNLWNLNPNLALSLHSTISLSLGVNFLWRFDSDDAVYGPPFNTLVGAAPHGESYLGTAYNLALDWEPHSAFKVSIGYTNHEAGPSITALGGQSVDYLQVALRLEF